MLDCTVFLTSDFPAVALVVCSEDKVAHGFDRLSHKVSGRIGGRRRMWSLIRVEQYYVRPSPTSQAERPARAVIVGEPSREGRR